MSDRRDGITAASVVDFLGSAVLATQGDLGRAIVRPIPLSVTERSDAISFCSATGARALDLIAASGASVVICSADIDITSTDAERQTLIAVKAPRLEFLRVLGKLFATIPPRGIHPTAVIHPDATIADDAYVGPLAYVGRCVLGAGAIVHGGAHLYDGTRVGDRSIIHSGTVIGADGFGYQKNEDGVLEKFPHYGGVVIEDDVEIGANTCIDRGTLGDTIVKTGAKIDNFVHIAHNVVVGRHAAVIAHAMIGGSTIIGDYSWIAPSACVRDGLKIGDRAVVGLGAVVVKDVPAGATVMGSPARDATEYKKLLAALRQLAADGA